MRRVLVVAALAAACAAAGAAPASATDECKGLQVCVPVTGPWVLATPGLVQFQLSCPKRFIIGGLDAEVSSRGIEVGFVGSLGSPVNPGVTTTSSAVFLGRLVRGRDPAPAFRPHLGCIPAQGGGGRVPTAYRAYPPSKPSARRVTVVFVQDGSRRRVSARCGRGERVVAASHAIGFPTQPTVAEAHAVLVSQHAARKGVTLTIASRTRAVVQIDLVCGAL